MRTTWIAATASAAALLCAACAESERTAGSVPDAGPLRRLEIGPIVVAPDPPPPISGGTLTIATVGKLELAIAADPDLDRVFIVDLRTKSVRFDIGLAPGDEPGRAVVDAAGRVHVALRSAGEIATIDPFGGEVLDRRAVCPAPRGVAYEAATDRIHVACRGGELVTLPAAGGAIVRSLRLEPDLRDVIVAGDRLVVTRFRSAELLWLSGEGVVVMRTTLPSVTVVGFDRDLGERVNQTFVPAVAWRAVGLEDGSVAVVHQRAQASEVGLSEPNGYGGSDCGAIVHAAMTIVTPTGTVRTSEPLLAPLPVDVAAAADGASLTLVSARSAVLSTGGGGVVRLDSAFLTDGTSFGGMSCGFGDSSFATLPFDAQAVAIAYDKHGRRVVQSRAPARLYIEGDIAIALSTRSVRDTGHDIFHMDSRAGLACASCHAEGHEDGHVWLFEGLGPRRTQDVSGGILGTRPFHWGGEMRDLDMLMGEVFVERMGGGLPSPEHTRVLGRFIDQIPSYVASPPSDAAAVERGRALFQSTGLACAGCHAGERFSNNLSVDVGTGGAFQVPSLIGVGGRAPYLHHGAAATLRDRFSASGGGDRHGRTSGLDEAGIADLIAYLETL